jgi:hypothetical protein
MLGFLTISGIAGLVSKLVSYRYKMVSDHPVGLTAYYSA